MNKTLAAVVGSAVGVSVAFNSLSHSQNLLNPRGVYWNFIGEYKVGGGIDMGKEDIKKALGPPKDSAYTAFSLGDGGYVKGGYTQGQGIENIVCFE